MAGIRQPEPATPQGATGGGGTGGDRLESISRSNECVARLGSYTAFVPLCAEVAVLMLGFSPDFNQLGLFGGEVVGAAVALGVIVGGIVLARRCPRTPGQQRSLPAHTTLLKLRLDFSASRAPIPLVFRVFQDSSIGRGKERHAALHLRLCLQTREGGRKRLLQRFGMEARAGEGFHARTVLETRALPPTLRVHVRGDPLMSSSPPLCPTRYPPQASPELPAKAESDVAPRTRAGDRETPLDATCRASSFGGSSLAVASAKLTLLID